MDDAALVIAQELGEVGFEVTPRGSDNMTWFTQVSTDLISRSTQPTAVTMTRSSP